MLARSGDASLESAIDAINRGDIPGAVDCYEAALRLDPRDVETIIHLGNLYVGLKRYPDAETKFRAGLELQAKSPQALLGLAQTLDVQKKPEAAAAYRDYRRAGQRTSSDQAGLSGIRPVDVPVPALRHQPPASRARACSPASSGSSPASTPPTANAARARSPRPARRTHDGCSSRPPSTTAAGR